MSLYENIKKRVYQFLPIFYNWI